MSNRTLAIPVSLLVVAGLFRGVQAGSRPGTDGSRQAAVHTEAVASRDENGEKPSSPPPRVFPSARRLIDDFLLTGNPAAAPLSKPAAEGGQKLAQQVGQAPEGSKGAKTRSNDGDAASSSPAQLGRVTSEAPTAAGVAEDPCYPTVGFVIATLPDPTDSHLDWAFDADFESILRAYERAGYVLDRFWLPWTEKNDTTAPDSGGTGLRRVRDVRPGVVLFRRDSTHALETDVPWDSVPQALKPPLPASSDTLSAARQPICAARAEVDSFRRAVGGIPPASDTVGAPRLFSTERFTRVQALSPRPEGRAAYFRIGTPPPDTTDRPAGGPTLYAAKRATARGAITPGEFGDAAWEWAREWARVLDVAERAARARVPDLQVLFIVGEVPTAGVHKDALRRALEDRDDVLRHTPSSAADSLRIVGPSFSGSAPSLGVVLDGWRRAHPGVPVRVITGSSTSTETAAHLERDSLVRFQATVHSDSGFTVALVRQVLCPMHIGDNQVAILRESGTAYGRSAANRTDTTSIPCGDHRRLRASRFLQIPFPMNIGSLRAEFEEHPRTAPTEQQQVQQSRARLSLRDPERPGDRPPPTSALTAPTMEVVLNQIEAAVSANQIRALGILSSDVRDKLFLATELRRRLGDVQFFTYEGNALFLVPENNAELRGMLVVSSYPLNMQSQWWTPGRLFGQRMSFADDGAEGIHNAVLIQLGRGAEAADYGYPFHPVGIQIKPPVWISAIGRNQILPVTVVTTRDQAFMAPIEAAPAYAEPWPHIHFLTALNIALLGIVLLWGVRGGLTRHAGPRQAPVAWPTDAIERPLGPAEVFAVLWPKGRHALPGRAGPTRLLLRRRAPRRRGHGGVWRRWLRGGSAAPAQPPVTGAAKASLPSAAPPTAASSAPVAGAAPATPAARARSRKRPVVARLRRVGRRWTRPLVVPESDTAGSGKPVRRRALPAPLGRWRTRVRTVSPEVLLDEVRWGSQNLHSSAYLLLRALALLGVFVPVALVTGASLLRRTPFGGPGIGSRWVVLAWLVVIVAVALRGCARMLLGCVARLREVSLLGTWFALRGFPQSERERRSWRMEVVLRAVVFFWGAAFFVFGTIFAFQIVRLWRTRVVTFPLFLYRAAELDGGVSPLVPLLFAAAGYAAWCSWHARRIRDLGETTPYEAAWNVPAAQCAAEGATALPSAAEESVRAIRMRLFKVVPDDGGFLLLLFLVTVFGTLQFQVRGTVEELIGLGSFKWILRLSIAGSLVATCWAVYRLIAVWLALDRVLQELSETPLLPAFRRLPNRVAQLTRLTLWRAASRDVVDTVAAAQWRHLKQLYRHAEGELATLDMPRLEVRNAVCEFMNAEAPPSSRLRRRLLFHSDDSFARLNALLARFWAMEPDTEAAAQIREALKKAPSDENTTTLVRQAVPNLVRLWLRAAEEFAAVQVVDYIEWVLQQLRTLTLFLFVSLLLTIGLLASYPYQGQNLVTLVFLFVLIGTVGSVLYVMAALNRDDVLSLIAKTDPGRVNWDRSFIVNAFAIGVVPLLTLISSELPDWNVFSFLTPVIHAITGGG